MNVFICVLFSIFPLKEKRGEGSDEEGEDGAAAAKRPESDSDEESDSEDEEVVHCVNMAVNNTIKITRVVKVPLEI